jgi:hypothetical protein
MEYPDYIKADTHIVTLQLNEDFDYYDAVELVEKTFGPICEDLVGDMSTSTLIGTASFRVRRLANK